MNRFAIILSVIVLSSCCTKKVISKVDSSDTTSIVRHEHRTDSITKKEKAVQTIASVSDAVVIIEDIVYDTDKADSTGVAPIKQRKTTRIDYGNVTTTETETETEVDSTASETDSLIMENRNNTTEDRVEEKSSHPPLKWLVCIFMVIVFGLMISLGFFR